jgi:urease accessory protein
MRGERPFIFSNLREGVGVDDIVSFIKTEGMLSVTQEITH